MQQQAVAEEARVQEIRYEILLQVTTVKGEPYFIKHVEEARALKEGSITIVLSPGRTDLPESPVPYTVYLRWGRWAAEFDCRYDIEKDAVHRGLFAFKSTNHPIHREIHLLYPSNAPVLEEDTSLDDNGRPFLRLTLRQGTSDGKPRLPEELMTVEVYAKRIPAGQRREMSERELDGFGWEIEEGTSDPWELDL